MFRALLLESPDKKTVHHQITELSDDQLPEGNVLVDVQYSSLNYKDGLAITGKGRIVRKWPMVPGIDFVGTVVESEDARYQPGQPVVLTGWGVGEGHWGGMAGRARVQGDWLVPLVEGLEPLQVMALGTAGLTAMLCVIALEEAGIQPSDGPVVVTGASGGVGSVAVTLLSQLMYEVHAVTGRPENGDMLKACGAKEIVLRETLLEPAKPLEKQVWAGAVDTVGGPILAKLLAQMNYGGAVAACGLAGSHELPTTVMPFILRNVRLQGVDSVMCPREKRFRAWERLASLMPADFYQQACQEVGLDEVPALAAKIVAGQVTGRVIVRP